MESFFLSYFFYLCRFFLLLLFLGNLLFCSSDLQQELIEIEKEAKEVIAKQDKEAMIEVLEELEKLEHKESEKKIHLLDHINHNKNALYYLAPSKSIFLFSKQDHIYFLYRDQITSVSDVVVPDYVISSFSGNYWLFRYLETQRCKNDLYRFYSNDIEAKIEFQKRYEFYDACEQSVITDTGKIYQWHKEGIIEIQKEKTSLILPKKKFKKILKKNIHRVYLYPLPRQGIWIFYGNAGYYDLYYYDEHKLKRIYKGVAQPEVYYVAENLFYEDQNIQHYYFVYTGGAGQYSFLGFLLPDQNWKSFNIPYQKDYVYIMKSNMFIFSKENNLYLYNPESDKEFRLPIKANQFFVYTSGLILLTNHRLYIRKESFSQLEKKIFVLKEELEYNIR